ncbi:DUF3304 domain-containing protein [Schlegelella aquatica]|uniref:DUF3304 domain-containing protein n=1 Tax=Caldimonas aquatica TaxID=376175 RepID=UPI003753B5F7
MPWLLVLGALVTLLAGCASPMPSDHDAVAVTAVNYTGRELNAVLFIDPQSTRVAGGTGADPYGASGAMCCYALPRRWQPGIKVKVRYDWWTGSSADRRYETVEKELPPYPTDEPGVLWALFYEDGSVEVLASAVDPGHPKWPGKVKHWPVPSREYRLKLWQIEYDKVAGLISYYQELMDGLPSAELEETWRFRQKYSPKDLDGFSGPHDPRFKEALQKEGARKLTAAKERLRQMESIKP